MATPGPAHPSAHLLAQRRHRSPARVDLQAQRLELGHALLHQAVSVHPALHRRQHLALQLLARLLADLGELLGVEVGAADGQHHLTTTALLARVDRCDLAAGPRLLVDARQRRRQHRARGQQDACQGDTGSGMRMDVCAWDRWCSAEDRKGVACTPSPFSVSLSRTHPQWRS